MITEPQLAADKFCWQPNVKILLFTCLMTPLLISLGFWQLERAAEKRQILSHYTENQQAQPITAAELDDAANLRYRAVWLVGKLDASRRIFLDNRVRNGRPGYEVFELLTVKGYAQKVLVNRGWVQASLDRNQLPAITPVESEVRLSGSLYRVLKGGFQLDDGVGRVTHWPGRVGWMSADRAQQLYAEDIFPYQLRLASDSPGALRTGWPTVAVQPEKHTAYAVQWFVMTAVLLLLTVAANSNLMEWLKQKRQGQNDE